MALALINIKEDSFTRRELIEGFDPDIIATAMEDIFNVYNAELEITKRMQLLKSEGIIDKIGVEHLEYAIEKVTTIEVAEESLGSVIQGFINGVIKFLEAIFNFIIKIIKAILGIFGIGKDSGGSSEKGGGNTGSSGGSTTYSSSIDYAESIINKTETTQQDIEARRENKKRKEYEELIEKAKDIFSKNYRTDFKIIKNNINYPNESKTYKRLKIITDYVSYNVNVYTEMEEDFKKKFGKKLLNAFTETLEKISELDANDLESNRHNLSFKNIYIYFLENENSDTKFIPELERSLDLAFEYGYKYFISDITGEYRTKAGIFFLMHLTSKISDDIFDAIFKNYLEIKNDESIYTINELINKSDLEVKNIVRMYLTGSLLIPIIIESMDFDFYKKNDENISESIGKLKKMSEDTDISVDYRDKLVLDKNNEAIRNICAEIVNDIVYSKLNEREMKRFINNYGEKPFIDLAIDILKKYNIKDIWIETFIRFFILLILDINKLIKLRKLLLNIYFSKESKYKILQAIGTKIKNISDLDPNAIEKEIDDIINTLTKDQIEINNLYKYLEYLDDFVSNFNKQAEYYKNYENIIKNVFEKVKKLEYTNELEPVNELNVKLNKRSNLQLTFDASIYIKDKDLFLELFIGTNFLRKRLNVSGIKEKELINAINESVTTLKQIKSKFKNINVPITKNVNIDDIEYLKNLLNTKNIKLGLDEINKLGKLLANNKINKNIEKELKSIETNIKKLKNVLEKLDNIKLDNENKDIYKDLITIVKEELGGQGKFDIKYLIGVSQVVKYIKDLRLLTSYRSDYDYFLQIKNKITKKKRSNKN